MSGKNKKTLIADDEKPLAKAMQLKFKTLALNKIDISFLCSDVKCL